MSKSKISAVVLSVGFGLALGLAAPAFAGEGKPSVSRAAAKPLKAAQDACTAKNYDECVAKARETLALGGKTNFDAYVANQMLAFAYARQGNNNAAAQALEAQLATGIPSPAEQNQIGRTLTSVAYQQKNYPKAIELGRKLIASGGADADTYTLVAQAYYVQDKYKDAAKFLGDFVSGQESRGQTPKEQSLQLVADSYLKAGDNAANTVWLEKLVAHYPKPNYWNSLLYSMMRADGIKDNHTLHIYRLMQDTGTLKQPNDYSEMAQLAIESGMPGEAKKVLEAGMAGNIFTDANLKARNQRLLDAASKSAATDQASLAKFEAEAKAAKTGEADIALGRGYMSHGMNDKAAEAFARGIGKGSLKTAEEAQILLGTALLRAGNKAEAQKTFKAVKSADGIYQRVAKLWSLHAS